MMDSLLVKNVLLDGRTTDILVADHRFRSLSAPVGTEADEVIDASGMAYCYGLCPHSVYCSIMSRIITWLCCNSH